MMRDVRGKWLLTSGIVLFVAVLSALLVVRGRLPMPPQPAAKTAAPQPAAPEISLQGQIQAKTAVKIPALTDGIVERFLAEVGEDVFEGELLATIKNTKLTQMEKTADSDRVKAQDRVVALEGAIIAARLEASRARADATRAKAEVDLAEKTFTRQQMLVKEGATPRLVFEKAEAEYKKWKADTESFEAIANAAEARVVSLGKEQEAARAIAQSKAQEADEAKADVGAGEVHSTVNGVVLARHGDVGEPVSTSVEDLFVIGIDLGNLTVVLAPSPQALTKIRAGQTAEIQIAEAPGALPGVVREVKGAQVFVDFANPLPAIRPGLSAQVKIKVG